MGGQIAKLEQQQRQREAVLNQRFWAAKQKENAKNGMIAGGVVAAVGAVLLASRKKEVESPQEN